MLYRAGMKDGMRLGTWLREAAVRESLHILGLSAVTQAKQPMKQDKLVPCGANVLISRKVEEEKSKGGVILPNSERETPFYVRVLDVDPDVKVTKKGDRIAVSRLAGVSL